MRVAILFDMTTRAAAQGLTKQEDPLGIHAMARISTYASASLAVKIRYINSRFLLFFRLG